VPSSADGIPNGKWNHVLIEADFTKNQIIRAIVNQTDYSGLLSGKAVASQVNTEAAKTGIVIMLYNQGVPVRGAEFFVGRAILYRLS
jgi:hypothetical protein